MLYFLSHLQHMEYKTLQIQEKFAIIRAKEGSLEVIYGDINMKHDDLHYVEKCELINGELFIKAKRIKILMIDETITPFKGSIKFQGVEYDQQGIIDIAFNGPKILGTYLKHTLWMKLLGRPAIEYRYVNICNGYEGINIILKVDFWDEVSYQTNSYILSNI